MATKVKIVTNGEVKPAAGTADAVIAAFRQGIKDGGSYRQLFKTLPAPTAGVRKARVNGEGATVKIVDQCRKALARAATAQDVADWVAKYGGVFDRRALGQLMVYPNVDKNRIANRANGGGE